MVFPLVIVNEPSCVVSHCLYHKDRLSSWNVTGTCYHVIHAQGVVCLLPQRFGLAQGFGSHHDVPQP